MSPQALELVEDIEKYRALTERLRGDELSVWGPQMRLYGEKISDLIGSAHGLDSDNFSDRDQFLKRLREIDAIDQTQFRQLDKIRWVGNKLTHGLGKSVSEDAKEEAWSAFTSLQQARFWTRHSGYQEVDVERLFEAFATLAPSVGKFLKGAGKVALVGAGVVVATKLAANYAEYTNTPEYKAEQARRDAMRRAEQERKRIQNEKDLKAFMTFVGYAAVAMLLIGGLVSAFS